MFVRGVGRKLLTCRTNQTIFLDRVFLAFAACFVASAWMALHPNGSLSLGEAAEAWRPWSELIEPKIENFTPAREARDAALTERFRKGAAALDAKRAAQEAARRVKAAERRAKAKAA
jgi:hypothetical protein